MLISKDHMKCMYTRPHQRPHELHVHMSSSKTTWKVYTQDLIKDYVTVHTHALIEDHMNCIHMSSSKNT